MSPPPTWQCTHVSARTRRSFVSAIPSAFFSSPSLAPGVRVVLRQPAAARRRGTPRSSTPSSRENALRRGSCSRLRDRLDARLDVAVEAQGVGFGVACIDARWSFPVSLDLQRLLAVQHLEGASAGRASPRSCTRCPCCPWGRCRCDRRRRHKSRRRAARVRRGRRTGGRFHRPRRRGGALVRRRSPGRRPPGGMCLSRLIALSRRVRRGSRGARGETHLGQSEVVREHLLIIRRLRLT